ncbi:MAG: mechanosensitive ion channel family protein [Candidatus Promineofilum sp.]|nr:mechanosensitive ion channel family protein [Promineifilum sp.]
MRRLLLLLASPLLLVVALSSLMVGVSFYAESNPATFFVLTAAPATVQAQRVLYLLARAVLFPFQLGFIVLAFGAALWVFRRRLRIGGWVLGEPVAGRLRREEADEARPTVLRPERRLTLQQIIGSILAVLALGAATVLSIGQFVPRADLAVVIAALTSGLTWGARLPIGDVLGGISNIFETNVSVGERIRYKQFAEQVEGQVEDVDLRFLNVRADSGELTSIPHGELRIFRNFSRGETSGVYATFPVRARDLNRAVALLTELAGESPVLTTQLVEPWHVMSLDGRLGGVTAVSLFGRTTPGNEDDLQLALHTIVQLRFAAAGIPLAGGKEAAA